MTGPLKSHPACTIDGIIGSSTAMQETCRRLLSAAGSDWPVLLMGETGTGKNLMASTLHQLSPRGNGPFLRIACGSIRDTEFETVLARWIESQLIDSDLSGSGARGATERKGGTLFLDQIDQLGLSCQSKLLDLIQEGHLDCWQEHPLVRLDWRIIAATSQDLEQRVKDGQFREDLYWKLSVLPIGLPPLRRREGDVELLIDYFWSLYGESSDALDSVSISPEARKALVNYSWPGNIHELQNYLQRCLIWGEGQELTLDLLPAVVSGTHKGGSPVAFRPTDEESLIREFIYNRLCNIDETENDLYRQIIHPVEKELLWQVMEMCQQTQTKAASWLGINRNTLYKKLVEFELIKPSKRDET
jgi:DNA-binding NtrC family response regulator